MIFFSKGIWMFLSQTWKVVNSQGMYIQNHGMKPTSTTKLFYIATYTVTVDHSGYCYCYRSVTCCSWRLEVTSMASAIY